MGGDGRGTARRASAPVGSHVLAGAGYVAGCERYGRHRTFDAPLAGLGNAAPGTRAPRRAARDGRAGAGASRRRWTRPVAGYGRPSRTAARSCSPARTCARRVPRRSAVRHVSFDYADEASTSTTPSGRASSSARPRVSPIGASGRRRRSSRGSSGTSSSPSGCRTTRRGRPGGAWRSTARILRSTPAAPARSSSARSDRPRLHRSTAAMGTCSQAAASDA